MTQTLVNPSTWRYYSATTNVEDVVEAQIGEIHVGEIYAKQTPSTFVMYNVLKVLKGKSGGTCSVTLQNIDNPLSLFETTVQKLTTSGYIRISQTPYIDLTANTPKKRKAIKKPVRCPYTLDFLESRADSERPAAVLPDLFTITT